MFVDGCHSAILCSIRPIVQVGADQVTLVGFAGSLTSRDVDEFTLRMGSRVGIILRARRPPEHSQDPQKTSLSSRYPVVLNIDRLPARR